MAVIYYLREVGQTEPFGKAYNSKGGARREANAHNANVDRHRELLKDGTRTATPLWLVNKWEVVAYSLTFAGVV